MPFWKIVDEFVCYCLIHEEKPITQCYNEYSVFLENRYISQPKDWMLLIKCGEYARKNKNEIFPKVQYCHAIFEV